MKVPNKNLGFIGQAKDIMQRGMTAALTAPTVASKLGGYLKKKLKK